MKRQIIRINYIVIVSFLTIIFNVNDLRVPRELKYD